MTGFVAQRANFPFERFGRDPRVVVAKRFAHLIEHGFDGGDEAIARPGFARRVQSLTEIAHRAFERDGRIAMSSGECAMRRRH